MEAYLSTEFMHTLLRFITCVVVNWGIIHLLYYRKSRRSDFYFTFMLMTVVIFFLVYFMMGMDRGKATMGVGLGLFGIFSIMRYRTDAMPVREMTYMFLTVCMAVVHAMAESYPELLVVDVLVIISILLGEMRYKVNATKLIQYDRIEMIKPEKREELIADLKNRTGLSILKVEVGGIDFLKDSVVLRVTYDGGAPIEVDKNFTVKKSQWREV